MSYRILVRAMTAACLAATALLGGCSFWGDDDEPIDCSSVEEYQSSQSAASLSLPQGLDRPDETGKLKIPEEPLPAEPLSANAACLQRPPNYFDKPLAPAAPN